MVSCRCLHCGTVLQIPDEYISQNVTCRRCGGTFWVDPTAGRAISPTAQTKIWQKHKGKLILAGVFLAFLVYASVNKPDRPTQHRTDAHPTQAVTPAVVEAEETPAASRPEATNTFTGKCVGVTDGDTIEVMHNGQGEKIRLHGIDCL